MNQHHWENVYKTNSAEQVSWYQEQSSVSLKLITQCNLLKSANIIDVGCGASSLVLDLLKRGYSNLSVLDISEAALLKAKQQLGQLSAQVKWMCDDITQIELEDCKYHLWHDRAVFHFFTEAKQRQAYIKTLVTSLAEKGNFILSTFALDGPQKCSGLPIINYNQERLTALFAEYFELINFQEEVHKTPFDTEQKFIYCHFKKR